MTYIAHNQWFASTVDGLGLVVGIGDTEQQARAKWKELYQRIEREKA